MLFALLLISLLSFLVFLDFFLRQLTFYLMLLLFCFLFFFIFVYVFGTLLDVVGLLVVGSGASDDVVGFPVDAVGRFVEGFAVVLRSPH